MCKYPHYSQTLGGISTIQRRKSERYRRFHRLLFHLLCVRSTQACELLNNNSLFVGQLKEYKSLVLRITQHFTARADLFLSQQRKVFICTVTLTHIRLASLLWAWTYSIAPMGRRRTWRPIWGYSVCIEKINRKNEIKIKKNHF